MEYLYHRVPKNMSGTILYPLNTLKHVMPDIYTEQVKKYAGRERILNAQIPFVDCLWNDVLHLTAVEPQEIQANLLKAGIALPPMSWFKIPVKLVEGENSVTFLYPNDPGGKPVINNKNYEKFDSKNMEVYRIVPEETIEYYKEKVEAGKKPLLFHLIPHILYKGKIETKDLEIITI